MIQRLINNVHYQGNLTNKGFRHNWKQYLRWYAILLISMCSTITQAQVDHPEGTATALKTSTKSVCFDNDGNAPNEGACSSSGGWVYMDIFNNYAWTTGGGSGISYCGTQSGNLVGSRSCTTLGISKKLTSCVNDQYILVKTLSTNLAYALKANSSCNGLIAAESAAITVCSSNDSFNRFTGCANTTLSSQTITGFTTPTVGTVGSSSSPTATATSGLTPVITVDASSSAVCSYANPTVTYNTEGTCTLNANQVGNGTYAAAPQVQLAITVSKIDQTISGFTTPTVGIVGGTASPTATATSGLMPIITVDASSSAVCSYANPTVTYNTGGTCTLNANQVGNGTYASAPQVQLAITVSKIDQTISGFTTPTVGIVGGTASPTATATSGLTPIITVDASSSAVCSYANPTVTYNTEGTCTLNANQVGDGTYNAAPQVQLAITVGTNTGTLTPAPIGGAGEPITYTTTFKDSGGGTINTILTVVSVTPVVTPPVNSLLGPIKIESDSNGMNGYSLAVVFKLNAGSASTFTGFMKFGPQTNGAADEWYDYGTLTTNGDGTGYVISDAGKTITIHLIDNIRGDDKLDGQDGKIVDPALIVVQAAVATSIPTLTVWGLLILISLLSVFGFRTRAKT
jgi:exosortase sorting signal-containing protein